MAKKAKITSNNAPQIESLFRMAFNRMKDRLLSYYLTVALSFVIIFVSVLAVVLIAVLLIALTSTLHNPIITGIIGTVAVVCGYLIFTYVVTWMQLSMNNILMQDKQGVMESIKYVKPYVWGYVGYTVLFGLLMIGLLPFGILSLLIVFVLWAIWSRFAVFVYLDYKKTGLQSLWISRSIINQNFWGVVLRIGVVYIAFYLIMVVLGMYSDRNSLVGLILFVLSLVAGPFIISYLYEIYLGMNREVEIHVSKVWIVLSVIGGIILILGLGSIMNYAIKTLPKELPNLMKQIPSKTSPWETPKNQLPASNSYNM